MLENLSNSNIRAEDTEVLCHLPSSSNATLTTLTSFELDIVSPNPDTTLPQTIEENDFEGFPCSQNDEKDIGKVCADFAIDSWCYI